MSTDLGYVVVKINDVYGADSDPDLAEAFPQYLSLGHEGWELSDDLMQDFGSRQEAQDAINEFGKDVSYLTIVPVAPGTPAFIPDERADAGYVLLKLIREEGKIKTKWFSHSGETWGFFDGDQPQWVFTTRQQALDFFNLVCDDHLVIAPIAP